MDEETVDQDPCHCRLNLVRYGSFHVRSTRKIDTSQVSLKLCAHIVYVEV